jgi:hypothetical protein
MVDADDRGRPRPGRWGRGREGKVEGGRLVRERCLQRNYGILIFGDAGPKLRGNEGGSGAADID